MISRLLLLMLPFFFSTSEDLPKKRYAKCEVRFLDGEQFEGLIQVPLLNEVGAGDEIYLYDNENAEVQIVPSSKVKYLQLKGADGASFFLERSALNYYGRYEIIEYKHDKWLEIIADCETLRYYNLYDGYTIHKKTGELQYVAQGGFSQDYLKREGENAATKIGKTLLPGPSNIYKSNRVMLEKGRQKVLLKYFANNQDALSLFKEGKGVSADRLISYVNSNCN